MNVRDVKTKSTAVTLLDGKERHMRFTLNAMANLEDKYGSIDDAFNQISGKGDDGKVSMSALRYLLWQALKWEDATLTEEALGELIDIKSLKSISQTLGDALKSDMPEDETAPAAAEALPDADPNA